MVFEPDRSRIVLFDPAAEGRLVAMQASVPDAPGWSRAGYARCKGQPMESFTRLLIATCLASLLPSFRSAATRCTSCM